MKSNSSASVGVRKGIWTAEEDFLLRKCIEKYGVGKWHQVPLRAGLNRCRKSCRLRWLNYLRPDIKRGSFTEDEEDLIIRLHKLLGNRWSLIAGRLPRRTANDVKNYWNTHMQKKLVTPREDEKSHKINETTIIKPRTRTFSRNPPRVKEKTVTRSEENIHLLELKNSQPLPTSPPPPPPPPPPNDVTIMEWWANLFAQQENNGEGAGPLSFNSTDEKPDFDATGLWSTDQMSPTNEVGGASNFFKEDDPEGWSSELFIDINMWDGQSYD